MCALSGVHLCRSKPRRFPLETREQARFALSAREPNTRRLPEVTSNSCARVNCVDDVARGGTRCHHGTPMSLSTLHEALVLLFRNRPALAPELLQQALGVTLPAYTEVRIESADLTQTVPTEYRADLVVLLVDGRPVLAIVVEVQLTPDPDKRWSWPVYLSALRARLRCPCLLLVVTIEEAVARWAATPIEVGPAGFVLTPLVLGPGAVPIVTEQAAAVEAPELAVLSAMAHGGDREDIAVPIAWAALRAVDGLDEERAKLYADLVLSRLGEAAKAALEALMLSGKYEYQSDFAKKYIAQGKAEGEAKGKAEAVIAVLEARGLAIPDDVRRRVAASTDLAELGRWLRRAAVVDSAREIFADLP